MDVREKLVELIEPHMSGLACEYESGSCELTSCRSCNARNIADHLIANGVTVQEWVSVNDRLPDSCGFPCLLCGENSFGQIRVFEGFTGYMERGKLEWHSNQKDIESMYGQ